MWLTCVLWRTSAPCSTSILSTGRWPFAAANITGVTDYIQERAIKYYSQHTTLHTYSIMCVECLQYFSDNNTCHVLGLIHPVHIASWFQFDYQRKLSNWARTILTSVYTTQRTHMLPQQDWILLLDNRPKSRLFRGQLEEHRPLFVCQFWHNLNQNVSDHFLREIHNWTRISIHIHTHLPT